MFVDAGMLVSGELQLALRIASWLHASLGLHLAYVFFGFVPLAELGLPATLTLQF